MRNVGLAALVCLVSAFALLGTSGTFAQVAEPGLPAYAAPAKALLPYPKLDPALNAVLASPKPLTEAEALGYKVRGNGVHVNIVCREGQASTIAGWLNAGKGRNVLTAWDQVEALVPIDLLASLNDHPNVEYVRHPSYGNEPEPDRGGVFAKAGEVESEGVAALGADLWHAAGYTGQGVKVGIIDSFGHYELLLGTELPGADDVEFQDFAGIGTDHWGVHGVACAEIVYDLVPGLERMYLAQVSTPVEIANAVDWMQANGVKVISMSMGWLTWGPGDGTGDLDTVVAEFVSSGGVWVNAAGNSALAHWMGYWRDSNQNGWLDFEPGREINWVTGPPYGQPYASWYPPWMQGWATVGVPAAMVYSQWEGTVTDLDLCLVWWNGQSPTAEVLHCAGTDNTQSGFPTEDLYYEGPGWGQYGFAVKHVSGPPSVAVEFFNRLDFLPLQYRTAFGAIVPPSDAAGAFGVAALDVTSGDLEPYSSWGPTNAPGGWIIGGQTKPDISSFANVSTVVYGPGGFSGTSSACPHVAGAAALVWSAHPELTNAEIKSFLRYSCVDKGYAGKDNTYGWGRLLLPIPP